MTNESIDLADVDVKVGIVYGLMVVIVLLLVVLLKISLH